jgi:hypothetical protein
MDERPTGQGGDRFEIVTDPVSKQQPDPTRTAAVSAACHQRGLITLTAGTYGNVLRSLPPLVIDDNLLREGLHILDEAFATGPMRWSALSLKEQDSIGKIYSCGQELVDGGHDGAEI